MSREYLIIDREVAVADWAIPIFMIAIPLSVETATGLPENLLYVPSVAGHSLGVSELQRTVKYRLPRHSRTIAANTLLDDLALV